MKKKYLPPLLNKIWKENLSFEKWFIHLRDSFCSEFLKLENVYNHEKGYQKILLNKKDGKKITLKVREE